MTFDYKVSDKMELTNFSFFFETTGNLTVTNRDKFLCEWNFLALSFCNFRGVKAQWLMLIGDILMLCAIKV